jgi:hypothetical protein
MAARSSQQDNVIMARHFGALLRWLGFVMVVYAISGLETALTSSSPIFGRWPRGTDQSPAQP